jgi:hypothetical protein
VHAENELLLCVDGELEKSRQWPQVSEWSLFSICG